MTDKQRYQYSLMHRKMTLLELARELGSITRACKIMGYSRQHYYNLKERFHQKGKDGLKNQSRRPLRHPLQASSEIEKNVLAYVLKNPTASYQFVSHAMRTEEGVFVTEGLVRGIFQRYGLRRAKDRLYYLEQEHQKRGFPLSEEQKVLLSRLSEKIARRHIRAPHTGYLLSQDTFFVGYLKGVGKLYMQSVVDCANSFGFARLYTSKDALTAAHMLQDCVFPFYHQLGLRIQKILTDNGREYCGLEDHPYQALLWLFDIQHRTTQVKTPRTNGFVERFHQTLLREFFKIKFRTVYYTSVAQLQEDLDQYLAKYNFQRAHQGYRLKGKTPYEGFAGRLHPRALPYYN